MSSFLNIPFAEPSWHYIVGSSIVLFLNIFFLFTTKRQLIGLMVFDYIIIPILLVLIGYYALGIIIGIGL